MGYQESYVRVKDSSKFASLVEVIQDLGKDYFFDIAQADPIEIITLKKPISGNLEMMCSPNKKYHFKPGEKFVYFSGERSGQRGPYSLMGDKAPKDLEIYFTECFPSDQIFRDPEFAEHEKFNWKEG